MLGGDNIFVSGPCFKPSDDIICEFSGGKATNGSYISPIQASCTVPMLYLTGRLAIKMSVNGGRSFDYQGIITIGKIRLWKPSLSHSIKDYFAKALSVFFFRKTRIDRLGFKWSMPYKTTFFLEKKQVLGEFMPQTVSLVYLTMNTFDKL